MTESTKKKTKAPFPSWSFQMMAAKHGFSMAEEGAKEYFCECLDSVIAEACAQSVINAQVSNGRKTLRAEDATEALKRVPIVPRGYYK